MTNKELTEHFKLEDTVFDIICSNQGNCKCCKYKYICEGLLPKRGEQLCTNQKMPNTKES